MKYIKYIFLFYFIYIPHSSSFCIPHSFSFALVFPHFLASQKRPPLCSNGRPAHRRPDRRVQGGLQPLRQGWRWSLSSDPSLSFSFFSLPCFTFPSFPDLVSAIRLFLGGLVCVFLFVLNLIFLVV